MRLIILCVSVVLLTQSIVMAESGTISAKEASFRPTNETLVASVDFLQEKFMALVLNESEWVNESDANGIYRCILNNVSHDENLDISKSKQRTKFLRYVTKVGKRMFDFDSPWLGLTSEKARSHQRFRQTTGNPRWTRSIKPDCSEPSTWKATYPNTSWSGFKKRCEKTAVLTSEILENRRPNFCRTLEGKPANPRWWGGEMDLHRVEKNWEEILCDDPGMTCTKEDRMSPNTPKGCSKNWYFRIKK